MCENKVEMFVQIAHSAVDLDELAEKGGRSRRGEQLHKMIHIDKREIPSVK